MVVRLAKYVIYLTLLTSTSYQYGLAQTMVYDAFLKGHNVGKMTVTREVNDESDKISVVSHIKAHMIVNIRVDFESHSTYMDGKLMESEASSKTNGHDHDNTHTIWKGDHYEVSLGRKTKPIAEQKLFGGDLFYFEEPANIDKVYSLTSGELLYVEQDDSNKYFFEHDGKKELHIYENGTLKELHIEHRLYTVIFKLSDLR